jgi:protein-S-isoprenylcysteine O-methyltransferase Ste14
MPKKPREKTKEPLPHPRGTSWIVVQAVIFAFFIAALVMGERMDHFDGLIYLRSTGLLLALFGSFVSIWAVLQFGSQLTPFPKPVEGATLIDSGPYRFVRHPMYTGIIAFTLGCGLAYATVAAAMAGPIFLIFFAAKTTHEEEMLVEAVPGYRAYRSAVHWRLIPKVI